MHLAVAQVKGQSDELSSGYAQLQEAQAELEQQRQQLEELQRQAEAERKAAKTDRTEAEAAVQQAAEARLAAAAEQRKLGQERLESLRAAEVVRGLQLTLAAHVRTAAAAQLPHAAELWHQLQATMGVDMRLPPAGQGEVEAAAAGSTVTSVAALPLPQLPPQEPPRLPPWGPGSAPLMTAMAAVGAAPRAAHEAVAAQQQATSQTTAAPATDDSQLRYRAILASLESSIDRWRAQLRAGEQLTFGGDATHYAPSSLPGASSGPLGGATFFLPAPSAGAAISGGRPPATESSKARSSRKFEKSKPAGVRQEADEHRDAGDSGSEDRTEDEEAAVDVRPRSPSRAVQTAVSCLDDAPNAFGGGVSSAPCSPARQRSGRARAAAAPRPASASAATTAKRASGSSSGGSFSAGDVRAVHGITIPASFSLPGSPQHAKPRKWLKFKSGPGGGVQPSMQSTWELDGCGTKGGWGGIFAFRRSLDGGSGGTKQ